MEPVECIENFNSCRPVPKCVLNVCMTREALLMRLDNNLRPQICRRTTDCREQYYCRILNNDNGFCCFGKGKKNIIKKKEEDILEPNLHQGQCPKLLPIDLVQPVSEPNNCHVNCNNDNDCSINEKCCFNGCGLTCILISNSFDKCKHFFVN